MMMAEIVYDEDGTKKWFENGKLHREDGPAVEYTDGTHYWYLNDELHRDDGPAIEHVTGTKTWWVNNKRHRDDGPAIEYADGTKYWYLNGNELPKEEIEKWLEENNINLKTNEGKMVFKLRWL